jgi:dinuclear metal center YbgI/SA1388 family protein
MRLYDIVKELDVLFCKQAAVEGDNVGLQIGKVDQHIDKILLTIDVTDEVIEETLAEKAGLIFTHHPLIFSPLLNITEEGSTGKKIIRLIENRVAVYAAHTNYDLMPEGVNDLLAEKIGLKDIEVLEYAAPGKWYKFVIFVPEKNAIEIRETICEYGGGRIGDYSCCTFNIRGTGTFKPHSGAKPHTGEIDKLNFVDEVKIECVVSEKNLADLLNAVLSVHPYEEPAYDIYRLENKIDTYGIGRIGRLKKPEGSRSFMGSLKDRLELKNLRWMASDEEIEDKKIEKVAVINGSANSVVYPILYDDFSCDLLVTGELKYHNALSLAEKGIIVVEIGHGESEKIAINGIYSVLTDRFKELKTVKSQTGFKPWRYYIE